MNKIRNSSIFKNVFFWIIFVAFLVSMLIIFVSPYLFEYFESLTLRLLIAFLIFFLTVTGVLSYTLFVKDEVKKIIRDKKEQLKKRKEQSGVISDKVQNLKMRFNEAMRIVKNSSIYKDKQNAGYELPWYLVVGKEVEGKTSLLEHSGLDFPLNINYANQNEAEEKANKSFQWYFAEHAIFVDMPGSYISNGRSDEEVILWESFLNLFGKKRWKRPINGIILTISVDTLLEKTAVELEEYAKDIRDRIDEISNSFMSNIPIYLLVSKTDKIVGFNEYFSSISEDEKSEVLGVTFNDETENIDTSVVKPELELLLERLNSSVLDKVHKEWDNSSRAKISLFCNEFSVLFEKLNAFIEIGFAQTRYRKPLMLRGIYFTSVPDTSSAMASNQEFEKNSLVAGAAKKGMFIKKVLTNIIFPEADIIKMDTNYKKNQRIKQIVALVASVIIVATATIYWIQDFNSRIDSLDTLKENVLEYDSLRDSTRTQTDFEEILGSLNKIRDLKNANEDDISNYFWKIAYYKVEDRNNMIEKHYKEALENVLLPRIAHFMEEQIQANLGDYDLTWESTKAYSMLNNKEKLDSDFLRAWLSAYWSHMYPNRITVQNDLNEHLYKLIEYDFKPYALNEKVLTTARNQLLAIGQESLVYKALKDEAKERNLPSFRFSNSLGSYASAFKGSDYLIPGFYTKKGFEEVIINNGKELIKKLVSNNWVVGYSTELSEAELNELYAKVQNYYFIDYKEYWMKALSTLDVPEYKSISELNNQLTVLTSGSSPIINVLKSLKENTMIYTPAEKLQMKVDDQLKSGRTVSIASENAIEEAQKITNNTSVKNVRMYFSSYNKLLDENSKPTSKLATAMLKLNNVYQEMTAIYGSVTPERDAYNIVIDRISGRHAPIIMQISSLPQPIDRWFKKALKNDWQYLLSRTNKYINEKFEIEVLGYYKDRIKGRYPIYKNSKKNDIRIENFEDFFKKDGILDSFYQSYISNFVKIDTRRGTYKYRVIDGSNMYIKSTFMKALLNAEKIREAFFNHKGDLLETDIFVQPHSLGRKLSRMEILYNDNYIGYEHGPIKAKKIIWPPESQNSSAKFTMYDLQKNRVVEDSIESEWGIYKLLDKFQLKQYQKSKGKTKLLLEYKKEHYDGSFEVTGSSMKYLTKDNPLSGFKLDNGL